MVAIEFLRLLLWLHVLKLNPITLKDQTITVVSVPAATKHS